jgi:tetratricopeptide (TPR) repeat protein
MHYDAETLFAFVEGTVPIEAGIETHVMACEQCSAEVEEQRRVVAMLAEECVWAEAPAPAGEAIGHASLAMERAAAEDEAAAVLCDEILTGPSVWWPQRLRKAGGACTAGMVRQLLLRLRTYVERIPKDALQIAEMAVALAADLDPAADPPHSVDNLHAQALRDRAFVLGFMSRYDEALRDARRSAELFATVPASDCERARLKLVRALVLRNTGCAEEAAALAREAGDTFLAFGERARYVSARITEGAVLYAMGAAERALEIWSSLQGDPELDDVAAVRLDHNVALCHIDLGRPAEAIEPLYRCVAQMDLFGLETERTRSRGALGVAVAATGNAAAAIPILRQAAQELAELGLVFDSGKVALDAAEAMLVAGRAAEAAAVCREVIARFTAAGLDRQAIPALMYLRQAEAAESEGSLRLVRLAQESLRLFAPSS